MADAPRAVIETKFGEIELEFLADKAPGHVENFLKLARDGKYDGTTFHRVIPGFMIQGGDPTTADASAPRDRHGTGRGNGYGRSRENGARTPSRRPRRRGCWCPSEWGPVGHGP